jgi:RadC-like JAB domain
MKTTPRIRRKTVIKPANPQVITAAEFKIVRLRECPVDSPYIENAHEAVEFWRKQIVSASWFKDDKECLVVFLLNTRGYLLGFELVSQGTKDTILVQILDIFRLATIHGAARIIIAHNHPSGDPSPSDADIKVTRDLIRAAAIMKIELIDHVVIGDARREKSYASLRELGYFYADKPENSIAAETAPTKKTFSSLDLEQTVNKACGLIDLFEIKLTDQVKDQISNLSSSDFNSMISSEICGFQTLAHEIKKELLEVVSNLFENKSAAKAGAN